MSKHFFSYVRVSVCSLSAVAVASCTKIAGTFENASTEPRRSDAPEDMLNVHLERGRIDWEEQRIDALESELQAVNLELRGLKQALDLLGPLPETGPIGDQLLSPANPNEIMDLVPDGAPIHLSNISTNGGRDSVNLSDIYADPPELTDGHSIFHGVRLAQYPTRGAAEADWARLTQELPLSGLEPRFEDLSEGVRLFAGPFINRESAVGMCFDLAPAAGQCEPSTFQGVLN